MHVSQRMESTGTPGRIQVSPSTAELLEEYGQFVLEDREGGVEAKVRTQRAERLNSRRLAEDTQGLCVCSDAPC